MKHKNLLLLGFLFTSLLLQGQEQKNAHTFLGVDIDNNSGNSEGIHINGTYKGYGAMNAGLKPGDILRTVNSEAIHSFDELVETLDKYKVGDEVDLSFTRNGVWQTTKASLSAYPDFLKYSNADFFKGSDNGEMRKALLGVDVKSMWEQYALLVTGFTHNSAAKNAGLQVGDIILKVDNYESASNEELRYCLSKYKPADIVTLTVKRDGVQSLIKVTLGEEIKHAKEIKEKKEEKQEREIKVKKKLELI